MYKRQGAAYATVIGQMVSMVLCMIFHYTLNREVPTAFRYLKPSGAVIRQIYVVGVPAIVMQAVGSFLTYGVNIIFAPVSVNAVTAYGVYYKIQQFAFFAGFGMNNAMIPLISFNYGKGDRKREEEGIRWGMVYTLIVLGICLVVLELFAPQIANIFALSQETLRMCALAMRIIGAGYLFAGANIALSLIHISEPTRRS